MVHLTLSDTAYRYYIKNTKRNANTTKEQAELKMTRNMMLALPYKKKRNKVWYSYGHLRFAVENNTVHWIKNNCKKHVVWYKDMEKYLKLNEELGIIQ